MVQTKDFCKSLGVFFAALLFAFHLALGAFWLSLPSQPKEADLSQIEGISIFTGGKGRLDAGLSMVKSGFNKPVLVTGVNTKVSVQELADVFGLGMQDLSTVTWDYRALSTSGNVRQTKLWASRYQLKKIIVITAAYHMPRSLTLFERLAPELQIVPYPVFPEGVSYRLLVSEFMKSLLVRLGIDYI